MAQPQFVATPFISERLTWIEIMERYRYEWVCLVEIEKLDDGLEVHSARVVGHGKTRQEALDQARSFHAQAQTPEAEIPPYFSRPFTPPKRQVAPAWRFATTSTCIAFTSAVCSMVHARVACLAMSHRGTCTGRVPGGACSASAWPRAAPDTGSLTASVALERSM